MSAAPIGGTPARPGTLRTAAQEEASLRKSAKQLEGVFVQQLFKAMRATVDAEGGLAPAGAGEAMFRDLFDQHMAERVPEEWGARHGLAERLYQQLRTRLATDASAAGSSTSADGGSAPAKETQ